MKQAALVLIAMVLGGASALAATHPVLHLVGRVPLEVRGDGFRPGKRLSLTFRGRRISVYATQGGRFSVRFPSGDRCSSGRVVATGPREYAVLYIPPMMCPVARGAQPG